MKIIGIHNESGLAYLSRRHSDLCYDDTIGFLLDDNVINYEISCLWTGASQFGQCQAVPPQYTNSTYHFISAGEWSRKLEKVRTAIGCGSNYMVSRNFRTNQTIIRGLASELYICNDRCVQGGIGYFPSIVMILALAVSFFQNCVDVPQ
uniref:Uncharacterized protein n=1 Tax=Caenorhabditis japonica TaxID=281687 RepID=A0A8R1HN87_CAEJA